MMGGLVSILAGHLLETIRLRAYAFLAFAGAAASLLFALVFALVALNHWIAVTYDSQYPELWIALAFVVIALIVLAVGLYLQKRKPEGNPAAAMALLAAPPAFRLAARRISPRTIAVGVVLIAGLALGRRFANRA